MIKYTLICKDEHRFDSWFGSDNAFAALQAAGHLACPICGSGAIAKSLMAPSVTPARKAAQPRPDLSTPANAMETAFAEMRRKVEKESEYVGLNFVAEARAIHDGDAPERSIWGEARAEEAKKLIEDGVKVAPLPFMPQRKVN